MTEEDLVTSLGRNPGTPPQDETDSGTPIEEEVTIEEEIPIDGDGDAGTDGRNPG